jgi:hypothetical protein
MRRGLVFALVIAVLAGALSAQAASPAFGRQRKRFTPPVSARPESESAPASAAAELAGSAPAEAPAARPPSADPILFPRPAVIEDRVRFWTRVYSEIETNEGFVHDNRDLSIVYDVVRWPKGLSEADSTRRFEAVKKRYAAILEKLARGPHDALSAEERRVLALFPPGVSRSRLREAAEGVRFQRGQADKFRDGVIRSGQWEAYIRQVFRERGLPLELTLLPHVESSFNPNAYSKVGAAGLWQFMPSTGRLFKLRVDQVVDERFDPWRATEAAAALLANNHRVTGSWPLALIALGTDDIGTILTRYEGPSFGFASRNFYPSFLAAVDVDRDHVRYFGALRKMEPARHEAVVLDGHYSARSIARAFGLDLHTLRQWNLGLRETVWSGRRPIPRGVTLRLPADPTRAPAARILASLTPEKPPQATGRTYVVKRGATACRPGRSPRPTASASPACCTWASGCASPAARTTSWWPTPPRRPSACARPRPPRAPTWCSAARRSPRSPAATACRPRRWPPPTASPTRARCAPASACASRPAAARWPPARPRRRCAPTPCAAATRSPRSRAATGSRSASCSPPTSCPTRASAPASACACPPAAAAERARSGAQRHRLRGARAARGRSERKPAPPLPIRFHGRSRPCARRSSPWRCSSRFRPAPGRIPSWASPP